MSEASHFEAKKHAYRQTQDGVVISFVVHPNDVSPAIAMAALGTRFMVAFAEIGDDEKPKAPIAQLDEQRSSNPKDAGANPPGVAKPKDRKPFASLPLSQQAALRCSDRNFRTFLPELEGEAAFHMYDADMAADSVRALCKVTSRSELDHDKDAAMRWLELNDKFLSWDTTRQYAESVRT